MHVSNNFEEKSWKKKLNVTLLWGKLRTNRGSECLNQFESSRCSRFKYLEWTSPCYFLSEAINVSSVHFLTPRAFFIGTYFLLSFLVACVFHFLIFVESAPEIQSNESLKRVLVVLDITNAWKFSRNRNFTSIFPAIYGDEKRLGSECSTLDFWGLRINQRASAFGLSSQYLHADLEGWKITEMKKKNNVCINRI